MQFYCATCQTQLQLPLHERSTICPVCGGALNTARMDQAAIHSPNSDPTRELESAGDLESTLPFRGGDLPTNLGRYRIEAVIGRGGFGMVYRAFDDELRRHVAIKVPRRDRFQSDQSFESFLEEARTSARLKHPSIVAVYDVGTNSDGLRYVVMDYIDGGSLRYQLAQRRFTPDESAQLMWEIATAVHHAHEQGFVHRDLKSANILMDLRGHCFVADFGLAAPEAVIQPLQRELIGTPPYMSPEQVRGENHRIDRRTDVWALGAILYELLTGRLPFGENSPDLFHAILTQIPDSPRDLLAAIPKTLDRICLRCLEKRMSHRLASAELLASELREWLSTRDRAIDEDHAAGGDGRSTQVFGPGVGNAANGVTSSGRTGRQIVPRGLHSFTSHDSAFFLELLPGPRDQNGLPDSIRTLKHVIESTQPEESFPVGILYGPSGCGKSSFLKAGLLPRLHPEVTSVYVEASPLATESRIRGSVCRALPKLNAQLDLSDLLIVLREQDVLPAGSKLLIVVDQFEQWLQAHGDFEETDLLRALRQCDGTRVTCLLAVRGDFGLAATRFMDALELPISQGRNFHTIDRFSLPHSKRVLAEFGRAYGQLPAASNDWTAGHRQFIDQAVQSLQEDGKVIPVRLALFAEMIKDRPWLPQTLAAVGGAEGVGVEFLGQKFAGKSAQPQHARHQAAARRVLQCFVPEAGSVIRGGSVSIQDLAAASGYPINSLELRALIQILDQDLRLITPVETEFQSTSENQNQSQKTLQPAEVRYQLTHDYLVPALRTWLTIHQRSSRRGRVELRFRERVSAWTARPESQQLPTLLEWLTIHWYLPQGHWNESEHRMMQAANRKYARQLLTAATVLSAVVLAGLWLRWWIHQDRERTLAHAAILRYLDAEPGQISLLAHDLDAHQPLSGQLLREQLAILPNASPRRTRIHWYLLRDGDGNAQPFIDAALAADLDELKPLARSLPSDRSTLNESILQTLHSPDATPSQILHAACLAAATSPNSHHWNDAARPVVDHLLAQNPIIAAEYSRLLYPARQQLLPAILSTYRAENSRGGNATLAASILADFAADDTTLMVQLLMTAEPECFGPFMSALENQPLSATPLLIEQLQRRPVAAWPSSAGQTSASSDSPTIEPAFRRLIEASGGMLTRDFAIVQQLPLADFEPLAAQLNSAEFRPHCFRPFRTSTGSLVAAIWWHDGLRWHAAHGLTPADVRTQTELLRVEGLVPYDLAFEGFAEDPTDGSRWSALWCELNPDIIDSQMYIAIPEPEHSKAWQPLNDRHFIPRTNVYHKESESGIPHYSSVRWRFKTGHASDSYNDCWSESTLQSALQAAGSRAIADVRLGLSGKGERVMAASWWQAVALSSKMLDPMPPQEQQTRWTNLAGEGWRPVSVSVVAGTDSQLVSTTVWHQRRPSTEDMEQLARQQARVAIALLRLGHSDLVWPLLSDRTPSPLRHWLMHLASELRLNPQLLWHRLETETDVSVRRALLIALADFPANALPTECGTDRCPLAKRFREDSDAGVHAAVEFLAGKVGIALPKAVVAPAVAQADVRGGPIPWQLAANGHTMVQLYDPPPFRIGAAEDDFPVDPESPAGDCRIPRSFAISNREVTVAQFLRHRPDFSFPPAYAPDPRCPMIGVSIHDALGYCNWLSEQSGIPPSEWCYIPDSGNRSRLRCADSFLQRTGFRLPTEAEWEFACRAGTPRARHFGSAETLLPYYARTASNSGYRGWPVAGLRPNDFGLFDMLGNAMEICHGGKTPPGRAGLYIDDGSDLPADIELHRQRRGGAFLYQPGDATSHHRDVGSVHVNQPFLGFRVAQTLKPASR